MRWREGRRSDNVEDMRGRGMGGGAKFGIGTLVVMAAAYFLGVDPSLLMGIMEFGRAYNAQVSLTNAAREGVRVMTISNNQASARTAAKNAAVSQKAKKGSPVTIVVRYRPAVNWMGGVCSWLNLAVALRSPS